VQSSSPISQQAPAKADSGPVLELKQVSKTYQSHSARIWGRGKLVTALNRVSLSLKRGEIFGLVGESGSGKTTCGRLIVALEKPDSGSILLEGRDLTELGGPELKEYRRRVQMVFQDPYQSFNPQLTIAESVAEPLITHQLGNPREREEKVLATLKTVGLSPPEEYAYRFPHQLSGGQRQRAAIARAIITEPACLVADEPTSMLDASYAAQIFEVLLEVREKLGTTIMFITHSLAAARYLCDRIAVIYWGNLMETGRAAQVIENPRHPYTQALMDATPRFGEIGQRRRFNTLLLADRPAVSTVGCAFFRRCEPAQYTRCALENPAWHTMEPDHLVACHYADRLPGAASG
jgi:peptide/nickel transport system ATP-binding protein